MQRYIVCAVIFALATALQAQIELRPVEGFNLKIVARPAANVLVVKPDPPINNWFAGKFVQLPVGEALEIRVDMTGCDTPGNVADTGKWVGLRPVYSYADPEQYASYEWFRRDALGRWVSGDLFKQGAARFAGDGELPEQKAIPVTLAGQFRSPDGTFWSPWGEIAGGQSNTTTRIFTFTVHPAAPEMTIAMHVPYLIGYDHQVISRLKAAHFPGVFVDELGRSGGGRPLYIIRVDDPLAPAPVQITPVAHPTFYDIPIKRAPAYAKFPNYSLQMTESMPTVRVTSPPGHAREERRLMFLDARQDPERAGGQLGSARCAESADRRHPGGKTPAPADHLAAAAVFRSGWLCRRAV